MRPSPSHLLRCVIACSALSAACHKHHKKGPPHFELSCRKGCERVTACDESIDVEECRQACLDSLVPFGAHLRDQYLDEYDQCMVDARCRDLGVSAFDNECRHDASERIGVNLETIALCDAVSEMLARCSGRAVPDATPCQQSMKIFNDDTLEEATACGDESCHDISKCFTVSLGVLPNAPMPVDADE